MIAKSKYGSSSSAFCDSTVCMFSLGPMCVHDDRCTVSVSDRYVSTCTNVSVSTLDTALLVLTHF